MPVFSCSAPDLLPSRRPHRWSSGRPRRLLRALTPDQGSQLASSPTSVTLRFSESVGFGPRSVEVLDAAGHRVDDGAPLHVGADVCSTVEVGVPARCRPARSRSSGGRRPPTAIRSPEPSRSAFRCPRQPLPRGEVGRRIVSERGRCLAGIAERASARSWWWVTFFFVVLWPPGFAGARTVLLAADGGWSARPSRRSVSSWRQGPYAAGLGHVGPGSAADRGHAGCPLRQAPAAATRGARGRGCGTAARGALAGRGQASTLGRLARSVPPVLQPGRARGSRFSGGAGRARRRHSPRCRLRLGGWAVRARNLSAGSRARRGASAPAE